MGKVYIGNEEVSPLLVRGGTTDGLTKAQADKLYVGKTDASNTYLKKTDATSTYVSKTDADENYLPNNNLLNWQNIAWGDVATLNLRAQNWRNGVNLCGMTMLSTGGTFTGQFLSTSNNVDPNTGATYNTFDVCAMNGTGWASGFVCRLDEGEDKGTVELFSPKELSVYEDSNLVPSTSWVQRVIAERVNSGSMSSVIHNNTLIGDGSYESPLGVNLNALEDAVVVMEW